MSVTSKNSNCQESIKILGDFWTLLIIDKLSDGPLRFCDLEQRIAGVNTATLTTRLKNMANAGLVARREQSRADVTYELTEHGRQAVPILEAIDQFSAYSKNHPER